ncbi:Myosin light polypeptide 6 [Desmophyllum pertusum]|uniref:Myosin light polypeptide 6 n=1 Tax=Desmophyllum pertusum TaxID=174260 RepID=A0A9X0CL22_9CNID|nr:Myosin light polypeptide 6 [Desmophyllum pertusum]
MLINCRGLERAVPFQSSPLNEQLCCTSSVRKEKKSADKMSKISDEDMSEFKDAYCLFDRVGDGKIDGDQIEDLLRSMGLNPQGSDLKQVRDDFKDKRVEFEEWLGIYTQFRSKPEPVREDFIEGFKCYDRDGTGTIDGASLRGMLCLRGDSRLTEDEANDILAPVEDAQKGVINYEEIIKLVMSRPEKIE